MTEEMENKIKIMIEEENERHKKALAEILLGVCWIDWHLENEKCK